jgi:hypothetical protein
LNCRGPSQKPASSGSENADEKHREPVATDFTNAFGSVPDQLIMSAMKERNFPGWTQKIVADMDQGASSVFEVRGGRSGKIP